MWCAFCFVWFCLLISDLHFCLCFLYSTLLQLSENDCAMWNLEFRIRYRFFKCMTILPLLATPQPNVEFIALPYSFWKSLVNSTFLARILTCEVNLRIPGIGRLWFYFLGVEKRYRNHWICKGLILMFRLIGVRTWQGVDVLWHFSVMPTPVSASGPRSSGIWK